MIAVHRKPRKCPTCGSTKIAKILYGLMGYSEELKRDLEAGRVVLGGCGMSLDNPNWECASCGKTFKREADPPFFQVDLDDIPF